MSLGNLENRSNFEGWDLTIVAYVKGVFLNVHHFKIQPVAIDIYQVSDDTAEIIVDLIIVRVFLKNLIFFIPSALTVGND